MHTTQADISPKKRYRWKINTKTFASLLAIGLPLIGMTIRMAGIKNGDKQAGKDVEK
jgi:hypothetical protein